MEKKPGRVKSDWLRIDLIVDYEKNMLNAKGCGYRNAIMDLELFFRQQYNKNQIVCYYQWDNIMREDYEAVEPNYEVAQALWDKEQKRRLSLFTAGQFDSSPEENEKKKNLKSEVNPIFDTLKKEHNNIK